MMWDYVIIIHVIIEIISQLRLKVDSRKNVQLQESRKESNYYH